MAQKYINLRLNRNLGNAILECYHALFEVLDLSRKTYQ